jgi:hypothetical protein
MLLSLNHGKFPSPPLVILFMTLVERQQDCGLILNRFENINGHRPVCLRPARVRPRIPMLESGLSGHDSDRSCRRVWQPVRLTINSLLRTRGSAQHKVQKTLDDETWPNAGVKEEDNIA